MTKNNDTDNNQNCIFSQSPVTQKSRSQEVLKRRCLKECGEIRAKKEKKDLNDLREIVWFAVPGVMPLERISHRHETITQTLPERR